jgi:ribulose kinase
MAAEGPAFAEHRHIVPDWLGNRATLGNARVRALVYGLGEETTRRSFLEHYYATARALALQSRQIFEHLNAHGYAIDQCAVAGGHLKNPLLGRLYRDALGVRMVFSDITEPVLLGTAMVASVGAGRNPNLFAALDAMAPEQVTLDPHPRWQAAHEAAYRSYLRLFEVRNEIESRSKGVAEPVSRPEAR